MVRSRWLKRLREEAERIKDSDMFETVEEVFDVFTLSNAERLRARGVVWVLKGVVSSGKEARIYWGKSRDGRDLAVKIYLTATAEFRNSIRKYIMGDPRFERIPAHNFRKLIYEWARKEFRNLRRLHENGVRVPEPLGFSGNIVVMQFLGDSGYRAPLLVEVADSIGSALIEEFYHDLLDQVKLMVCKAGLVHADLSEYNVMVWQERPWIIDVSQSVLLHHPLAQDFLRRDLENLRRFFGEYIELKGFSEWRRGVYECL